SGTVGNVHFTAVENLFGGSKKDSFRFGLAGSVASLDGGAGSDRLVGPNRANQWAITGANRGMLDGMLFGNVENLVGGTKTDTFRFGRLGSIGSIDGVGSVG